MRVLVVGSGGREHALAWKLSQNANVDKIFAVPGNAGIAGLAECVDLPPTDVPAIAKLAEDIGADLTVVGPEAPLVAGLADELDARGLTVFGPTAAGARIEGSKAWAKEVCEAAGAPCAASGTFSSSREAIAFLDRFDAPYVVKADGLAAGKGVVVAESRAEAERAISDSIDRRAFGDAGARVVIEEFLDGEELSVFCLTDGMSVIALQAAQDFKRAGDGDTGPNTGGMGSYSPVPHLDDTIARATREIFEPVIAEMASRGVRYRGVLYGGLMITADGPKMFEFNCRFGDPETEVLMPRLRSDLGELLLACGEGTLAGCEPQWLADPCVTVILASGGYPGAYETGRKIAGLDAAARLDGVNVFHAGTARAGDDIVTNGGRVLAVTAIGGDIAEARARAYDAASMIDFEGKYNRTDIAAGRTT